MLRARVRSDVQCSLCGSIIKDNGKRKHESRTDHRLVDNSLFRVYVCLYFIVRPI